MRFSIDVRDTEVAGLLNDLVQIIGIEPWMRRFEWLNRERNENHFMEDWLRERCWIEWTLNDVLRNPSLMPRRPFRIENIAQYELVGFAAGTVRSYELLGEGRVIGPVGSAGPGSRRRIINSSACGALPGDTLCVTALWHVKSVADPKDRHRCPNGAPHGAAIEPLGRSRSEHSRTAARWRWCGPATASPRTCHPAASIWKWTTRNWRASAPPSRRRRVTSVARAGCSVGTSSGPARAATSISSKPASANPCPSPTSFERGSGLPAAARLGPPPVPRAKTT